MTRRLRGVGWIARPVHRDLPPDRPADGREDLHHARRPPRAPRLRPRRRPRSGHSTAAFWRPSFQEAAELSSTAAALASVTQQNSSSMSPERLVGFNGSPRGTASTSERSGNSSPTTPADGSWASSVTPGERPRPQRGPQGPDRKLTPASAVPDGRFCLVPKPRPRPGPRAWCPRPPGATGERCRRSPARCRPGPRWAARRARRARGPARRPQEASAPPDRDGGGRGGGRTG